MSQLDIESLKRQIRDLERSDSTSADTSPPCPLPAGARVRGEEPTLPDEDSWPEEAVRLLSDAGCWRQVVPREFGGDAIPPAELLRVYEAVGWGSLTLALILTQHDRACELIATGENPELAQRLLPRVAAGEALTTVGISQLTTSRRHGGPALRASPDGGTFRLDGIMPWVTSASKADYVVTGAVLDDDRQILACVPTGAEGVTVAPPMRLMALSRSRTSEVRCEGVRIGPEHLVRAPAEKVLTLRAAIKPSAVAAVGLGVAGAILDLMRGAVSREGAEFQEAESAARRRFDEIRQGMMRSADALALPAAEGASMEMRVRVNDLLARLAGASMVVAKGRGYLADHAAQRLAREALFFMVWSAPDAVRLGTLQAILR
jgi:alkylation response protein AidB-like acyl-CoA dehydrogenase